MTANLLNDAAEQEDGSGDEKVAAGGEGVEREGTTSPPRKPSSEDSGGKGQFSLLQVIAISYYSHSPYP